MKNTLLTLSLALATVATSVAPAQAFTTIGVGGRIEQQIAAIQRNVPLSPNPNSPAVVPWAASDRRIFVRFIADSNRTVTGFDLKMKVDLIPEVVDAWLYTANAQNRPGSIVATGEIGLDTTMRYCRASFRDSYNVVSGQLYFVAFTLTVAQELRMANVTAGSPLATTYFVTASGPAQTAGLQLKVNADGYSPHCTTDKPWFNSSYTVRCTQASDNQPGVLWFTLITPGTWLDLTAFGANGSFLYLNPAEMLLAAAVAGDGDRSREVTMWMPYVPNLQGTALWLQWQIATPSLASGWATSDMALTIIN